MLFGSHILGFGVSGVVAQTWPTWDGTLNGTAAALNTAVASSFTSISSCKVDTDKTFHVYRYNSSTLECVITTTSGKVITVGTPLTIASVVPAAITCCMIDATHVMVCYGDATNSKTRAVVISISGTTCSAGSIIDIDALNQSSTNSVVLLNTNRCVVAYNGSGSPQVVCLTISGTNITKQTDFGFTADNASSISLAMLTSSTVAATWGVTGTNNVNTVIFSVSTNTITAPTSQSALSTVWNGVSAISCSAFDSTHYIAIFSEVTTTNGITYCCSVSGTTITIGSKATFDSNGTIGMSSTGPSIAIIDSTTALIFYKQSSTLYAIVVTISGTTVTSYTRVLISASSTSERTAIALDASRVIIAYADNASPQAGFAKVLSI